MLTAATNLAPHVPPVASMHGACWLQVGLRHATNQEPLQELHKAHIMMLIM
jgi:hypothetical protein